MNDIEKRLLNSTDDGDRLYKDGWNKDDDEKDDDDELGVCLCGCRTRRRCVLVWTLAVVLLAAVGAVAYTVGVPLVAGPMINQLDMEFTGIRFSNPHDRQIRLQGTVTVARPPLNVLIPSTNFTLAYEGQPLGYVQLPAIMASAAVNQTVLSVDEELLVAGSGAAIASFFGAFVSQPSVDWQLSARPFVFAGVSANGTGGVPIWLWINKTLSLQGCSGLKNATIGPLQVAGRSTGLSVASNVTLVNPSAVAVSLGAPLSMDLVYEGQTVGSLTTRDNFDLKQGPNFLRLAGSIEPSGDGQVRRARSHLLSNYANGLPSHVELRGQQVDESPSPSWLQHLVQAMQLRHDLPGLPASDRQSLLQAIALGALNGTIATDGQISARASVSAVLNSPFQFNYTVTEVSLNATARQLMGGGGGPVAGILRMSPSAATFDQASQRATVSNALVTMDVESEAAVAQLFADVLTRNQTTVSLEGNATATVDSVIGPVQLRGIRFPPIPWTMHTFDGFKQVKVDNMTVQTAVGSSSGQLNRGYATMTAKVRVFSSTRLSVRLPGTVTVDVLASRGGQQEQLVPLGNVSVESPYLHPGWNTYDVSGFVMLTGDNEQIARKFISQFVRGLPSPVFLTGCAAGSTVVPVVNDALNKVHVAANVPGLAFNDRLIQFAHLYSVISHLFTEIGARLQVRNPFNVDATISAANLTMHYNDNGVLKKIGSFSGPLDPVIYLPGGQTVISPEIIAHVADLEAFKLLFKLLKGLFGSVPVQFDGTLDFRLGDNLVMKRVEVSQDGIPASMWKSGHYTTSPTPVLPTPSPSTSSTD